MTGCPLHRRPLTPIHTAISSYLLITDSILTIAYKLVLLRGISLALVMCHSNVSLMFFFRGHFAKHSNLNMTSLFLFFLFFSIDCLPTLVKFGSLYGVIGYCTVLRCTNVLLVTWNLPASCV